MKVINVLAVLALLVMGMAVYTNPTREQYIMWLKSRSGESGPGVLGVMTSAVQPVVIDGTTLSRNYLFFSVYQTRLIGGEVTALGAFGGFLELGKAEPSEAPSFPEKAPGSPGTADR